MSLPPFSFLCIHDLYPTSRLAYRSGVTSAISAPVAYGFYSGLGTAFSTGAEHKLKAGAVLKEVTGVHVAVRHFGVPSVSTQIATLRRLLLHPDDGDAGAWFKKVVDVSIMGILILHCLNLFALGICTFGRRSS